MITWVDNALDNIVTELVNYSDSTYRSMHHLAKSSQKPKHVLEVIDIKVLSMLVDKYINYHRLQGPYYYAIAKTSNDSVVLHLKITRNALMLNHIKHVFQAFIKMNTITWPCIFLKGINLFLWDYPFGLYCHWFLF
ncbi:MAG: hypothetical protein HC906_15665 [Bacteroidales bacterium]|nr:hypothetical protein [Bacteroidales bacterium]